MQSLELKLAATNSTSSLSVHPANVALYFSQGGTSNGHAVTTPDQPFEPDLVYAEWSDTMSSRSSALNDF